MLKNSKNLSVLLLLKKNKFYNAKIVQTLKKIKKVKLSVLIGSTGSKYPKSLKEKNYDYIISYLSPWILPPKILKRTKKKNINFHPSLPKYPGFGCYNLSIYNNDKFYGITCHEMEKKVDSGKIFFIKKFRVKKNSNLDNLIDHTYREMFKFFKKKINILLSNKKIIIDKKIKWNKKNYSKKQDIEKLSLIKLGMSDNEASKRIKSTYLKNKFYPKIYISGKIFNLIEE